MKINQLIKCLELLNPEREIYFKINVKNFNYKLEFDDPHISLDFNNNQLTFNLKEEEIPF